MLPKDDENVDSHDSSGADKQSESPVVQHEGHDEVAVDKKKSEGDTRRKTEDSDSAIGREESENLIDTGTVVEATSGANAQPDEAAVPEKLADDVILPPLWKRVIFRAFPKLEKSK